MMAKKSAKPKQADKFLPGQQLLPFHDVPVALTDPVQLQVDRPASLQMGLALDLGTKCGYCYTLFDPRQPFDYARQLFFCGQLDLSIGNYDSRGIAGIRLFQFLTKAKPDLLFFEDVRHTPRMGPTKLMPMIIAQSASTSEFFGGLKMIVSMWGEQNNVPVQGIPIADIKRRATGKGNAAKEDIVRAYNALFGQSVNPDDYSTTGSDNMCDAVFALLCGLETNGNGLAGVMNAVASSGSVGGVDGS